MRSLLLQTQTTRALLFALFTLLTITGTSWGQRPRMELSALFPAGAQRGTSVDVTLTGKNFVGVDKLHISHPGITAALKPDDPNAEKKTTKVEVLHFEFNVAASVPSGIYEVRAVGDYGISNPRAFHVGDKAEIVETEPNNSLDEASDVPLNTWINGKSDVADYFTFQGQRGQRIIIDCWAQRVDSRMDAVLVLYDAQGLELVRNRDTNHSDPLLDFTVPEDGRYTVEIHDLVYNALVESFYRLWIGTGPYIDYIFPPAGTAGSKGQYVVYGRNLPGGTPASGMQVAGKLLEKLPVTISFPSGTAARQLSLSSLVEPMDAGVDGFEYRLSGTWGTSNPALLGIARAPVVVEREPNNDPAHAEVIHPPCEVAGQFYPQRDKDWFTFQAKKGDVYWIEVISQRMGLRADPYLVVEHDGLDDDGNPQVEELAAIDDFPAKRPTNLTQFPPYRTYYDHYNDDPRFRFVASKNGTYRILVYDSNAAALPDARQVYRLVVRHQTPDFRLIAGPRVPVNIYARLPWTLALHRGGAQRFDVTVFRRDGFAGPIELSVRGLPSGVRAASAIIGPGNPSAPLILIADPKAPAWAGTVEVVGKAVIDGKEQTRIARSAAVIMRVNYDSNPFAVRMTRNLGLSVNAQERAPFALRFGDGNPVHVSRGGKIQIPVQLIPFGKLKGDITLKAAGLLYGINAKLPTLNAKTLRGMAEVTAHSYSIAGTYTLFLEGSATVAYRPPADASSKATAVKDVKVVLASTSQILTVVDAPVAMKIKMPAEVLTPSKKIEAKITIRRLYDFTGSVQVRGVIPKGVSELAIPAVSIAEGQNEATLVFHAGPNVTRGTHTVTLNFLLKYNNENVTFTRKIQLTVK